MLRLLSLLWCEENPTSSLTVGRYSAGKKRGIVVSQVRIIDDDMKKGESDRESNAQKEEKKRETPRNLKIGKKDLPPSSLFISPRYV
jgi:hypothetical protein